MSDPMPTYIRRVERNALLLNVLTIVVGTLSVILGIVTMLHTVPTDCFDGICTEDHPLLGVGIGLIVFAVFATVFVLTISSYLRMRAYATARRFSPPPIAPGPAVAGTWPPQPGAFP